MIFLFEQFAYNTDFLEGVLPQNENGNNWNLPKGFVQKESNGLRKLDGVGYLYNANSKYAEKKKNFSHKIVFILPKVFLEESLEEGNKIIKAFGQVIPTDKNFEFDDSTKEIPKEFLSNLSLWVCASIGKYRLSNPVDNSVEIPEAPKARHFDRNKAVPSLIDVMIAMKSFYAENQNLFVFTAKNKYSGNNRINWRRTISRTQPFLQDGAPIYMDLENKKKVIDIDDRLLVLYFSAMHYIEEIFSFRMPHSEFYIPLRVNEFRRLLGHRGLVELRHIKHKYFADKFLKLYNIMQAFFEWGGNFSASNYSSEYLLTSKYNNVFESMIDALVGDSGKDIDELKHNEDGKIIDHLYKENSLIFAEGNSELIWHIGDSKYYKDPKDICGQSIAKQYTYAKNIVQDFFSPKYVEEMTEEEEKNAALHEKDIHRGIRYRDPLTEGYSITPNFFIRGELPKFEKDVQYKDNYFRTKEQEELIAEIKIDEKFDDSEENKQINIKEYLWEKRNRHFANRLFDRDTLLLQVYNINFLYVLKAYTSKHSSLREDFKRESRRIFRKNFLDLLDEKYVFWAIWPKIGLISKNKSTGSHEKDFVNKHFRLLVGKIFKPANLKCLILALEEKSTNGADAKKMWKEIEKDCKMIARVTPREIWRDRPEELKEAVFKDAVYIEALHGFFIKKYVFERAEIGKKHRLPKSIENRILTGSVYPQLKPVSKTIKYSDKDEYYFLPCK